MTKIIFNLKKYILSDDIIINYVNKQLEDKKISLGWNRDIFNYNDIKIKYSKNNVEVDIIYSENNKNNMCKTFHFLLENFI